MKAECQRWRGLLIVVLLTACAVVSAQRPEPSPLPTAPRVVATWPLDRLEGIGGHTVEVVGAPRVVQTDRGPAVWFDGVDDGLVVHANPLAGLARFTIEVEFSPDADGQEEQRFLHMEEADTANRALVELRMQPGARWALDTYLKHGDAALTLLDRTAVHPAEGWHVASLTFDGRTMRHYVDADEQGSGGVAFKPLGAGRTAIGMRLNRVSFFKGRVRLVRVIAEALTPPRVRAAVPRVIALWPEGVPGQKRDGGPEREVDGRISNVHEPSLEYYPPAADAGASGTAVIALTGGGYERLAMANVAAGAVQALTPVGVGVFVLKYRLKEYGFPAPFQDVLRAVRLVRSRASEFGVRPDRVGLFGASAGGHLAATAALYFDATDGRSSAALDATSARPDFVALLYPVITMKDPFAHKGSRRALLGEQPDASLVVRLSLEDHARPDIPPVFLVHTAEDASVPIENSLAFAAALRRANVPIEAHFYERGRHGFGMSSGLGTTSGWVDRWIDWMRAHDWM